MRVLLSEQEVENIIFLLKHTALPSKDATNTIEDLRKRSKDTRRTLDLVEAGKKYHTEDGVVEIDDGAAVSLGSDPGAYVQGWVWVSDADVKEFRRKRSKERKAEREKR